jgi:hypothetical protein
VFHFYLLRVRRLHDRAPACATAARPQYAKEVRHLLALTEANPQCVFVGRVIRDQGNFRLDPQYDYAVFGRPIAAPIVVSEKEMDLTRSSPATRRMPPVSPAAATAA